MRHKRIPFIMISITLSSCIRTAELPEDDASLENVNVDALRKYSPHLFYRANFCALNRFTLF